MDDKILVLIPAFNEEKTIAFIVDRCLQYSSQVMVVDDGSTDKTVAALKNSAATVLLNSKNGGKGLALLKGFRSALDKNYQGVITLDADGQHDPDDLPKFLEKITQAPEKLIIGARRIHTERAPTMRLIANKIADFFISCAARKRLIDTQSGYRYYPMPFLKQYVAQMNVANRFAFEAEILVAAARSGFAIQYVDIQSCYPINARTSHYHPRKDTWEIIKTVSKLIFKTNSGRAC
ncbi:MAG: glycosyltransferase family 2 protein [Gammaproteobacteria bacterium]|nr:glycosyltransferase family 2 protein [Gammaproteobacteria bacterium]